MLCFHLHCTGVVTGEQMRGTGVDLPVMTVGGLLSAFSNKNFWGKNNPPHLVAVSLVLFVHVLTDCCLLKVDLLQESASKQTPHKP